MSDSQPDLSQFIGADTLSKAVALGEMLYEDRLVSSDTGYTARTINHWAQVGLIDNTRSEGERWRRYNFVEFIWLKIIGELRKAGTPIEEILELKGMLFDPISMVQWREVVMKTPELLEAYKGLAEEDEDFRMMLEDPEWAKQVDEEEGKSIKLLHILIAESITQRVPISLAVFPGEGFIPIYPGRFDMLEEDDHNRVLFDTHTRVSITGIIKEFMADKDLAQFRITHLPLLEDQEARLLELIHSGEYKSVKINFRDRKMKSLELVKNQTVAKRIVDVLAEAKYQDIVIKTHDGKVAMVENTVKIQLL